MIFFVCLIFIILAALRSYIYSVVCFHLVKNLALQKYERPCVQLNATVVTIVIIGTALLVVTIVKLGTSFSLVTIVIMGTALSVLTIVITRTSL